jgi:DNA-binding NarL/FixJ family response regulator
MIEARGRRPAAGHQSLRRPDDDHGGTAVLLTPPEAGPEPPPDHAARGPLRIVVADDAVLLREGLRAAITARSHLPGAPMLVLSQYVQAPYAGDLLADGSGAVGYLLKDRAARVEEFLDGSSWP